MLSLADELAVRLDGKVPAEYMGVIQNELAVLLSYYEVKQISKEIAVYEGYLPQHFKAFFVTKKIEGASEKTLNLYMLRLKDFFKAVNKPFEEITANDVRIYLYMYQKEHNISNRTLDSIRSALCSFFSWSSGEGYCEKNIMLAVRPIKYERKRREALTDYELEELRAACNTPREEAILEFFYSTGCRVDELVKLNIEDVNFEKGEVVLFGKGSKHRISYLNARAAVSLRKYLHGRCDECPALFVKERGPHTRLSKAGIEKIIKQIGEKSGLERDVYPHLIRHTTATHALQHGMDVTNIQKMLGHANIATTMIYADVQSDDVRSQHKKYVV